MIIVNGRATSGGTAKFWLNRLLKAVGMAKKQPSLTMAKGEKINAAKVLKMFRKLTGREPSESDINDVYEKMGEKRPDKK